MMFRLDGIRHDAAETGIINGIDCIADDIPVKKRNQIIHMDTRLHAMQKYLSMRQEENQRDLIHAPIDKNLQDILLNHPNLLSDAAAVKAMDLGCAIMAYVGSLDDEFIKRGYIESERKPDPDFEHYGRHESLCFTSEQNSSELSNND